MRLRGSDTSTSRAVKVENTPLNALWLTSEHTDESIWREREDKSSERSVTEHPEAKSIDYSRC